jgi:type II secretory pathway pseudopilin PulG
MMVVGKNGIRSDQGFSLVEVLVGGFVLVVSLLVLSQFFASAAARVLESDIRSVLQQVASQEMEYIRGLDYNDVGTTDGHPQGVLAPDEEREVQNLVVHIHREVIFWTDSSYTGPYPANYRRVTVSVRAIGHDKLGSVELTSNVAGGLPGGTLDITVTDTTGAPVPNAQVVIVNNHLVPNVNINSSAMRTDANGKLMVPGLTPDETPSYVVSASKEGYNTATSDPCVVVDGLPYTVIQLIIDRLSTMRIRVVDTNGEPVVGLNLSVVGPDRFSENVVSCADGVTLSNIRYSSDNDPYIIRLLEGQGYDAQEQAITLAPGTTQDVWFTVPAGGPTTTTTSFPSTTTTSGITTTTTSITSGSLTIRVVSSLNGAPIRGARVALNPGGQVKKTSANGYVTFTSLSTGSYAFVITKSGYEDYRGEVDIDGATSLVVPMVGG